MAAKIKLMLNN